MSGEISVAITQSEFEFNSCMPTGDHRGFYFIWGFFGVYTNKTYVNGFLSSFFFKHLPKQKQHFTTMD